jgi:hypothetical protein
VLHGDQASDYKIDSNDDRREELHFWVVAIVIGIAGTSAKITRSMLRLRPMPIASLRFYVSDKRIHMRQTHRHRHRHRHRRRHTQTQTQTQTHTCFTSPCNKNIKPFFSFIEQLRLHQISNSNQKPVLTAAMYLFPSRLRRQLTVTAK